MDAQEVINSLEMPSSRDAFMRRGPDNGIHIDTLKNLTIGQIKSHTDFFLREEDSVHGGANYSFQTIASKFQLSSSPSSFSLLDLCKYSVHKLNSPVRITWAEELI